MPTRSSALRVYRRASWAWAVAAINRSITRERGWRPAVTTAAARVLGLEDRLGWLDVGREATFFLLDMTTANLRHVGDPLVALATRATSTDIKAVVVAGEIAYGALESDS